MRLSHAIFWGVALIALLQGVLLGGAWFVSAWSARMDSAVRDGVARAAGVTTLLGRAIEGNNYANVSDREALTAYQQTAGLRYFHAVGVSQGGAQYVLYYDVELGQVVRGAFPEGYAEGLTEKLSRVEAALAESPGHPKYGRLRDDLRAKLDVVRLAEAELERLSAAYPLPEGAADHYDAEAGLLLLEVPAGSSGSVRYAFAMPELVTLRAEVLQRVLSVLLAGFLLALGMAYGLARRITGPLHQLTGSLSEEALTRADVVVPGTGRRDEIGTLARRFTALLEVNRALIIGLEDRNREVEAANLAKSQFLANMSHEIRTPMNGVLGMVQLALDGPLDEQARPYLETVQSSGEIMLHVLNDILDISRLDADMVVLEERPCALAELGQTPVELFRGRGLEKGVAVRLLLGPGVPEAVVVDGVRLKQVLMNLVGNAVKFTAVGEVVLAIERVDGEDGAHRLRFSVTDTGIGIAADQLAGLFDRFSQADISTTRRYGGSGLGLAICRELVETLMGGHLQVESAPGAGSTFWFELTLEGCEPPEAVDVPVTASLSITPRILVAEDSLVNQRVVRAMMSRAGADVVIVDDGVKAVSAARSSRFDLIFLDWMMPEMDGLEVARCLRSDGGASAGVPIIALTANSSPEHASTCLAAGMDAFLTKPIDYRELKMEIITRLLPTQ